jgi:hypothetical protein
LHADVVVAQRGEDQRGRREVVEAEKAEAEVFEVLALL